MDQHTQEHRLISISSPLDKDKKDTLLLASFQGSEYISRLFEYQLDVLSSRHDISPDELIGKDVTVTIGNDEPRYFHGYVSRFTYGEVTAKNLRQYQLTVVPWMWFLTKTHDKRIFQEKTTETIISDIFKDYNFTDFEFNVSGTEVREYCVQYDESDFEFVSRLLEEEGISYYFRHEDEKHTLILVDKLNAYKFCKEKEVAYSKGNPAEAQITFWEHHSKLVTGTWTINDYNFEIPSKSLLKKAVTKNKFSRADQFEYYEYPSMANLDNGGKVVKMRMEEEEVNITSVNANSDCTSFYAGGKFRLTKHTSRNEKGDYLITAIHHHASDSSYFSGDEGRSEYGNSFECIPDNVRFRPQRIHKKPIMRGPQSAMVVGPKGDEIHTDEYGRVRVQFIWDRLGENDDKSSCYLRVVHSWAGDEWGTYFIPRIGQEVIVNYLDGDPDRPIVTGAVYNGEHALPFTSKTQSGIKTHTTKGGGKDNFNAIRFDDLKGSEEIYVQAEKDFNKYVKNDQEIIIDNNNTRIVVDGNEKIHIKSGNRTVDVKNNIKTTASDIVITGKKSIELKVGSSSIKMSASGIEISATKVDVKGSAMVAIKGGITKIN